MKEIFEQYGSAILTAIVAGVLFALFFLANPIGPSLLQVMGNAALPDTVARQEHYDDHADKQAFDDYASRKPPTATVDSRAVAGEEVYLLGMTICVSDCEGHYYYPDVNAFAKVDSDEIVGGTVKVLSITNSAGEDCTDWYHKDTDTITFERQGIYQIELYARDYYGVETKFICDIPVDLSPDDV